MIKTMFLLMSNIVLALELVGGLKI
jgi:hypothetical protein